MPSSSKSLRPLILGVLVLVGAGFAWRRLAHPPGHGVDEPNGASPAADASSTAPATGSPSAGSDGGRFPHAIRDPAKREELRKRLLAAMAETANAAPDDKNGGTTAAAAVRGNRDTNDIEEFGRFVSQAIREDFIPMAKECAKDLASRQPDAGGSVRVAFELLGDKDIGGVVNSSEIVSDKSTLHDDKFETCMRESMYGVYFDPPPAGGRATLNFDVDVKGDGQGSIDENVDDFHPRDRRNEKPTNDP